MTELLMEEKILLAVATSILIALLVALAIGRDNKNRWFRKRTKFSFFGKRGPLGDYLHFGYPCTWQGGIVTFVMLSLMALTTYCIFMYL